MMSLSIGIPREHAGRSIGPAQGTRRSTGVAVTFWMLVSFLGLSYLLVSVPDKPEIVFALALSLVLAACIVRWPVTGTFMAIVMATLFDGLPSPYAHTLFSDLGVFRNLSYLGLPEGVVVSLFELVVAVSLI